MLLKATTSPSTRLWLNLSLLKDKASWMVRRRLLQGG